MARTGQANNGIFGRFCYYIAEIIIEKEEMVSAFARLHQAVEGKLYLI